VAERAEAVASYAIAPLAWLGAVMLMYLMVRGYESPAVTFFVTPLTALAAGSVAIWGLVVRVRHAVKRTRPNIYFMPAMWLVGTLLWVGAMRLMPWEMGVSLAEGLKIGVVVLAGAVMVLSVVRVVQWSWRGCDCGVGRWMLLWPRLLWVWLLWAGVLVGVVPWCIGLIWVVVDSFW